MARLFDDAQSEYLRNANPVLTGVPMTMVAWFKSNDDAINQVLMSIGDNAGDLNIFDLSLRGDIDDKIYASLRSTTQSWLHSISVGTFSTGTWHHAAAVFTSATSRTVYLDGVAGTPETTSCTPLGLDATAIGRGERASPFGYMSGSLAEVAIWNAALSPAEIVALAAGEYPDTVRPGNLVAAWHLRDDDLDHVGEFDMTPYNTPSWSTHPPMKQPLAGTCAISSTTAGTLTILAGGLSDYAENKLLELITGKTPFAKPTAYIGFCTANPGEEATGADCNEVPNANGYGRTPAANWNAASGGEIANSTIIASPYATGSWGEITHYVLLDSGTYGEGDVLVYDELDDPRTIEVNDNLQFNAGDLVLTLN